jgi:hypothetical protein
MPQFLVSAGLPLYPAGLSDKEAAIIVPLYNAINALSQQVAAVTGNVRYTEGEQATYDQFTKLISAREQKIFVKAGEVLAYGNVVTLSLSGGKVVANKADATDLAKPGHAIIDAPAGIALNGYGEAILLTGRTLGITGTTFMAPYYLSTAGQVQATRPHGPGIITQFIGYGLGSAGFYAAIQNQQDTDYGAFVSTQDQTIATVGTPQAVTFNTTNVSRGVSVGSPNSRIYVTKQGAYNFQFSLQVDKTSGSRGSIWIWPRVNGVDIADSASIVTIKDNHSETVPAWNFVLALNAGDYFELMWDVDTADLRLEYFAATATVPEIPSAILTVTNNL